VKQKVKSFFSLSQDFTNEAKKLLEQYGNMPIQNIVLKRTPIHSMINSLLNFLSGNKFDEVKVKQNIDKYYHLAMIVTVSDGKYSKTIVVEKNERINISLKYDNQSDTQSIDIPVTKQITLNELLNNAVSSYGKSRIFIYDGLKANCSIFIDDLLKASGLSNGQSNEFLSQNNTLKALEDELPDTTKTIMKGLTDIANVASKHINGGSLEDGFVLHAIKISNTIPKDEQIKHVQSISKSKKKRLSKPYGEYTSYRIIPKTKFIKSSYRTKSVMNGKIKLVFGKLKSNN
jgi:uncharacterized protein YifE (UPF0438 family)